MCGSSTHLCYICSWSCTAARPCGSTIPTMRLHNPSSLAAPIHPKIQLLYHSRCGTTHLSIPATLLLSIPTVLQHIFQSRASRLQLSWDSICKAAQPHGSIAIQRETALIPKSRTAPLLTSATLIKVQPHRCADHLLISATSIAVAAQPHGRAAPLSHNAAPQSLISGGSTISTMRLHSSSLAAPIPQQSYPKNNHRTTIANHNRSTLQAFASQNFKLLLKHRKMQLFSSLNPLFLEGFFET